MRPPWARPYGPVLARVTARQLLELPNSMVRGFVLRGVIAVVFRGPRVSLPRSTAPRSRILTARSRAAANPNDHYH